MNRETKRMLQRQGELGPDGEVTRTRPAPSGRPPQTQRTLPLQFLKEIRAELRKVAWPTRDEVIRYSVIVLVTLIIVTTLIFGLDYAFAQFIILLFEQ